MNKVVKHIGDETTNKHNVKNKPIYNIIILFMYLFVYTKYLVLVKQQTNLLSQVFTQKPNATQYFILVIYMERNTILKTQCPL